MPCVQTPPALPLHCCVPVNADGNCRELQVERMKQSPSPTPIHKQTIIFDVAGLSARPSSVGLSLFRTTIDIDSNYYPERLGHFFIINAGILFRALWKVISLWYNTPTNTAKVLFLTPKQDRSQNKSQVSRSGRGLFSNIDEIHRAFPNTAGIGRMRCLGSLCRAAVGHALHVL